MERSSRGVVPEADPSSWATHGGQRLWRRHPAVRVGGQLTRGERAADALRNGMGSWAFVLGALVFLAFWMLFNRSSGFDPYPFILLNLVLSCLAALQGAILLIAAKRSDQIASELAVSDYDVNQQSLARIEELSDTIDELRDLLEEAAGKSAPTGDSGPTGG